MAILHALDVAQGESLAQVWALHGGGSAGGPLVDLTGYTAAMGVRRTSAPHCPPGDPAALVPVGDPVLTLDSAGGGVALGGALGTVTLAGLPAATYALAPGRYVWDLFLRSPGGVQTRVLYGPLTIRPRVSPWPM